MSKKLKTLEFKHKGSKIELPIPSNVAALRLHLTRNKSIAVGTAGLSMEIADARRWISWDQLESFMADSGVRYMADYIAAREAKRA